jgi:hypothetical protein
MIFPITFLQAKFILFTFSVKEPLNYLDFVGHLSGLIWVAAIIIITFNNAECEKNELGLQECDWKNHLNPTMLSYLNLLWTFCITIRATDIFSAKNSTRQLF